MKLWGGRFRKEEDKLMEDFNSSLKFDCRLYYEDITGSLAHVKMLSQSGILTSVETEKIIEGLNAILQEIETGSLEIEGNYEDIHSFVESHLVERVGDVGKKLHTGRSRNDQVAVDLKLYAKKKASEIINQLEDLQTAIRNKSSDSKESIMPGYTHLQKAQVVTFKHHLMAYYQMFNRDKKRVNNAIELLDENPLGSGALAGTTHEIDRTVTTELLGFEKPVDNFLDGVSDRDYLIELLSGFSIIMMHLSRLSEELILWSTQEFNFVEIDDSYSTGSSIMPQKKNPDAAELIRGKTGRVYGSLISLLTVMKGLPLAYNKDMQEDKEPFFDALDTLQACIKVMTAMIKSLTVNTENMYKGVKKGFLNATEVADYLVSKGVAFRDAHSIVGSIVIYCEDHNKPIEELAIEEWENFSSAIESDVYEYIDYRNILKKGIKKEM